jgi:tetratricopeptide (TPR) repeat protein
VDAAIDGTSHASGQRVQAAKTLAHTLDAWLKEPPASPGEQNVAEQAAFARGFALFEQGRFADAAAAFAFVPPSARLRIARGVALFAQGGYAEAAALFAQAAAMTAAPDARILPYLEQTGEFEPVARQIERFARMLPRNGRAQYAHGLILAPKDPQRAAPLFRLAAQLDPADPRPLLELAKLAATPTEAIPLLEAVIRIDPKQEQAHYRLGLLFQQQGDATKANQHFTEFRRLKSASTPAPPLGAPPR